MIKVNAIEIEVNGQNIQLSLEESRQLYNELKTLFGDNRYYRWTDRYRKTGTGNPRWTNTSSYTSLENDGTHKISITS